MPFFESSSLSQIEFEQTLLIINTLINKSKLHLMYCKVHLFSLLNFKKSVTKNNKQMTLFNNN